MPDSAWFDTRFKYQPPTDEQKPKYAAITAKERDIINNVFAPLRSTREAPPATFFDDVNRALREFAELIDQHCPESADKTAAIRCVCLARNAANEGAVLLKRWTAAVIEAERQSESRVSDEGGNALSEAQWCHEMALRELRKARYQANSAIACAPPAKS